MRNYFCFLVFAVLCLVSLTKCHKNDCHSEYLGDIRFTETDLKINPYTGTERLVFRDSVGDSLCYGSGVRYFKYDGYSYERQYADDYGCWGDYYKIEINITHFSESASSGIIRLDLDFGNPFRENNKYFIFQVDYGDNPRWLFNCEFVYDSSKISESYIHNYGHGSILSYNDSLNIGPNKYYSVYVLIQNNDPVNIENLKTVYYSINSGIVGFKTKQGHLWYLAN